jgi:hypothetical protein
MRPVIIAVLLCAAISGCATMQYPSCYKVEGREFKQFKDLDDEKALKVVCLIYNMRPQGWEEGIARSIALEEYLVLLSRRKNKYIKDSGIFQIQYDRVNIVSWKDDDLIRLQDALAPKAACYYMDAAPELTETQNAERIVYVTAIQAVVKELKKRDNGRQAMVMAGQLLAGALSIALSML